MLFRTRLAGGHRRRRRGVAAAGGLAGDRPPRRYRPLDARASRRVTRPVAFLFLGETLLITHLYPIVEALAEAVPDLPIELWVSTSLHAELIGVWMAAAGIEYERIPRAPGFRAPPGARRR